MNNFRIIPQPGMGESKAKKSYVNTDKQLKCDEKIIIANEYKGCSVLGAWSTKDKGWEVWFIQITIAKYLFNRNKRRHRNFLAFCFWALSAAVSVSALAAKCAKICIKIPEQSVPHTHTYIYIEYTHTHTPASATIKYQRAAAKLEGGAFFVGCFSPSFWGNAKLRYNGINLNKCRSQDFYAFLPHNKYFCCPQPPTFCSNVASPRPPPPHILYKPKQPGSK